MNEVKVSIALDFLKSFYLSDIDDALKREAKKILLDYFTEPTK